VTSQSILPIGGFDLLIAYDASALTAMEATPGQLLEDCGWEYFTYRYGADGNCGDACPSGLLRIIAIAEINNGANHPSCYGPPDTDPHELVEMRFLVTNDRTFECQYVPIRFFWGDCGDNVLSSPNGEQTFIDRTIHSFDGVLTWDEDDDDQFPEDARIPFVGAPDYCLNPDPEKPTAVRAIDFIHGGIDIVCADSIDDRGDINLNGVPYEVADAVLFINSFIYGPSVFTVNLQGQIAATDINADGLPMSVADLVYMIRLILGDAQPYARLMPVVFEARVTDGTLAIDEEAGAVYLVVEGEVTPELLANRMELSYNFDTENNVTRILVYSMTERSGFEGAFLSGITNRISRFEAATYNGAPITVNLVPSEFALYQCYPNPFNPVTTIGFSLPVATDWKLTIHNTLGQTVETFQGRSEPGEANVSWDASGYASGVYIYRLKAGEFVQMKKMVLLK
jgi:hypothetical protein